MTKETKGVTLFDLASSNSVIRFKDKINEQGELGVYAEKGMMARIVKAWAENDYLAMIVSYSEFEAQNKAFESANWNGKNGETKLTAREAGYYSVEEEIYLDENWENYFEVVGKNPVLEAFQKREDKNIGYIEWLEQMAALALIQEDRLIQIACRARHTDPMYDRLDSIVQIAYGLGDRKLGGRQVVSNPNGCAGCNKELDASDSCPDCMGQDPSNL